MFGILSLTSYLSAMAATGVFWLGLSEESLLFRIAGAAIATFGIWIAESAERRTRSSRASQAATLNGLLLLVMTIISLYLHFTG
ncbi:MAG TPA: hypothetical protein VF254_01470 [Gammaproteobacteria bacterium]